MVTMRQLEAFKAVIDHQTVTEAAKFMRLSQPAISKLISNLEYDTRLQLFQRVRRRLVPTDEAMILYEQANGIFSGLREIDRISGELRNLSAGRLNIVTLFALGKRFLPRAFSKFMTDRQEAEFSFHIHSSQTVNNWVIAQQVDLGFSMLPIEHPAVASRTLCRVQAVCAMPTDHPLAAKAMIEAGDLENERFISFSSATMMRRVIDHEFNMLGVRRRMNLDVYLSEAACMFVANGQGVSIVDPFTAHEFAARGELIVRPFRPQIAYEFRMLRPRNRPPSLLAQALSAFIQEEMDAHCLEVGARPVTV